MAVEHKKSVGIIVNHDVQKGFVVKPAAPSPDITGRLDRYDPAVDSWLQKAAMSHPRAGFGLHTDDTYLYAVGGTNGSEVLDSLERYNIATNVWDDRTEMPTPRCYMQTVFSGGLLYCIGGITADGVGTTSISVKNERYNPSNNTWATMTPMPTGFGVAMGVAHVQSGNIYVLAGYRDRFYQYNRYVLVYNIAGNSWTTVELDDDEAPLVETLLPFSFLDSGFIYIVSGLRFIPAPPKGKATVVYRADASKYEIATTALTVGDGSIDDLPVARFAGASATNGGLHYFIGGTNADSNTLRYFDVVNTSGSPFARTALLKLVRGRSSLGLVKSPGYLWAAGGVISKLDERFLKIELESVPERIRLDGKQTCAIDIHVTDENGDSPASVVVRLLARAQSDNGIVLFTHDDVTVQNGYGMATLIGRADDSDGGIEMTDDLTREYTISVSGSVLDENYFGDSDPPPATGSGGGSLTLQGGGSTLEKVALPADVVFKEYNSVITSQQSTTGSFLQLANIGGFLSLTPSTFAGGPAAQVRYFSDISWLPVVDAIIDDNEGTYETLADELDRISRQQPFGGSPILDAVYTVADTLDLDASGVKKIIYISTDGQERNSHYSRSEVVARLEELADVKSPPVVSNVLRVVPADQHLDQGVRDASDTCDGLARDTNGSSLYITTDQDVDQAILDLFQSHGFIGNGVFTFEYDLGEEVQIETIRANFTITDSEASGHYRYSIGTEKRQFSIFSDRTAATTATTVTLNETVGRFVRFVIELSAQLDADVYLPSVLVPPLFTSIDIQYHRKAESYIYWNDRTDSDELHQVAITLDATRPPGSEINVGVNTSHTADWRDYDKESQPALENDSRTLIPIRRSLETNAVGTLEALVPIDGFVFEAKYGRWSDDSTVAVYDSDQNLVDESAYKAFPTKGFVVFAAKTDDDYTLSITNQPTLSVATKIVNRVAGRPVVITGAGYMYSTLGVKSRTSNGTATVPQALNLLVTPMQPDVQSVFTANYSFYDLSGRAEKDSPIRWYINDKLESDLNDLRQWDNKTWKFAKAGDTVFFSVEPRNDRLAGRIVRSLPVILAG
jgi:hypothetical protein